MVEVGMFPAPPHFSWRPCDETNGGGRKLNALCVCVIICVLPGAHCFTSLCESLDWWIVIWYAAGLFYRFLVCSALERFLSGFRSLSWIFLASFVVCCCVALLTGCVCFCQLTPPVLYGLGSLYR